MDKWIHVSTSGLKCDHCSHAATAFRVLNGKHDYACSDCQRQAESDQHRLITMGVNYSPEAGWNREGSLPKLRKDKEE